MEKTAQKSDIRGSLFDWAQALVSSLILVILFFTFVARIISIDGRSMLNTLQDSDRVLISNLFYTPDYGDIIIFSKPAHRPDAVAVTGNTPMAKDIEPLVKRVIAKGGDRIRIEEHKDGSPCTVYLKKKGEAAFTELKEPYLDPQIRARWVNNGESHNAKPELYTPEGFPVPEGWLFVMGDNRPESMDSRFSDEPKSVGLVNENWIMGHLLLRLWPHPGTV